MMISRSLRTLAVLSLIAATTLAAQPAAHWRGVIPRDTVLARLRAHVYALAHDSMSGRRPPKVGNVRAALYLGREFTRLGLDPLHERYRPEIGYFDEFDYAFGVEVGPRTAVTIGGLRTSSGRDTASTTLDAGAGRFAEVIDDRGAHRYTAEMAPLGFSDTGTVEAPVVFAGYGITDSAAGYDDYAGIDARGAIVVVMRYSPQGSDPHGAMSAAMSWAAKVRNALRNGAVGIIFTNPPDDTSAAPAPQFDRAFPRAGLPCVFVRGLTRAGRRHAIRDDRGRDLATIARRIDSTGSPASFAPAGVRASITVDMRRLAATIPNVVGILPGNDPALRDEAIVIGAHFDHLGYGGQGSLHGGHDPAIHFGADDNASGTAGLLALADELTLRRDNRRTIVFAAFNAEEEGLLGSKHFVDAGALPDGLRPVAMINLDMIGRLDSGRLQVQGTGTSPAWEPILDSLNPGLSVKYAKEGMGPSDHSSFYSKDIPVLAFFTGVHEDYHKPTDTPEKINYDGQATIVGYVHDVVRALDRADAPPPFTKADAPASMRRASAFKVYVGTLPDYGYDGKGMRITGVTGGSPAEKAGLRDGDVIVRMLEYPIANIYDYMDALSRFSVGQSVPTAIVRAGAEQTVTIVMGGK